MIRRVKVIGALLTVLAVAGCGDMWGDLWGTKRSAAGAGDGGLCSKDESVLTQIILNPPTCSASTPCPCGSYCSSTITGVCVVDCRDDSECALGKTCSPYGQCLGAGANDGGIPANPTCPRSAPLLLSDDTLKRHCDFDDICPYGSRCDPGSGLCKYDCLSDSDCPAADGGSAPVCSCLGQCVEPAAAAIPPSATQPTLVVTPSHFTLPAVNDPPPDLPVWGPQTSRDFSVSMTAAVLLGDGTTPDVTITPGANVQIKCPGQTAFGADPCTFNLGALAQVPGTESYATPAQTVSMTPVPTVPPGDGGTNAVSQWQVRVGANGVAGNGQIVSAENAASFSFPGKGAGGWQAGQVPLDFQGTGYLQFTSPTGKPMSVLVSGHGDANWNLVLFDPTKMLSENGKFGLHDNHPSFYGDVFGTDTNDWISFNPNVHPYATSGIQISRITDQQNISVHVLDGGGVDGVEAIFDLFIPANGNLTSQSGWPMHAFLHLDRTTAPGTFCGGGAVCPQGLTCDLGFCGAETTNLPDPTILSQQPIKAYLGINSDNLWNIAGGLVGGGGNFDPATPICGDRREQSARFADTVLPISGEATCLYDDFNFDVSGRQPPTAVPLLDHKDLEDSGERQPKSAAELLRACLGDLKRIDPNTGNTLLQSFVWEGDTVTSPNPAYLAYAGDCISLGQWRTALGMASSTGNVNHWLLQEWLQVHAFIATEGLQENDLESTVGAVGGIPVSMATGASLAPAPTLDDLITDLEMGWARFFTQFQFHDSVDDPPRLTTDYRIEVSAFPGCQQDGDCENGRYCDLSGAFTDGLGSKCLPKPLSDEPDHEQPIGLPATMLNTMTAHLNVAIRQTEQTIADTFAQGGAIAARQKAQNAAGRALRFALWVESAAQNEESDLMTLVNGVPACVTCRDPKWLARWTAAKAEFETARGTLLALVATLQSGGNPLGLRDDDVPLFFGDVSGTNSRYFASSDYLLTGWAEPAVTAASGSLASARDAWIAQQNSQVQEEEAQANRERILDQIKTTYGERIINNCGPVTVGHQLASNEVLDNVTLPPATGGIDLDTCYIDPKCVGTDNITDGTIRKKIIDTQFSPDVAESHLCKLDFFSKAAPQTCVTLVSLPLFGDIKHCVSSIPFLNAQPASTLQPSADDFACFFGGTPKYQPLPRCGTAGAPSSGPGCYVECAAVTQPCTTEGGRSGCNSPTCLFNRNAWKGHMGADGSNLEPDTDFESNPWSKIEVKPGPDGRPWVYTTQKRVRTGDFCKIPADYFYGYYPESWTRENLATEYSGVWAAAASQCSSGDLLTFNAANPGNLDGPRYPMSDSPLPMPKLDSACFSGAMGQAQLAIQGAALKMQDTVEQINAKKGDLSDRIEACIKLAKDQKDADNARHAHHWFKVALAVTAIVAATAAAVISCGAAAPLSALIVAGGVAALAASVGTIKANMDQNIADLESSLGHNEATRACWEQSRDEMRALGDSVTEIQLGYNEIDTQTATLNKLKADNHQAALDGTGKVAVEGGRKFGSYAHSYWFDEKIDRYKKDFEWSRRLTYLAMEAVEYEFQQSLPYKKDILAATSPSALEDVIIALKQEQGGRSINRRRPESSSVVLSLRDDILKVADRSEVTTLGERAWTPAQRFSGQLDNTAFAYFDKGGGYLGQAVPFNLGPNGILETRCGERMWRVTATVQGDGLSDSSPNTSLLLLKRNTFSSQWCAGDAPEGSTMQSASIYPSAQLFKPGDPGAPADPSTFTPALMTPWFNIPRTDFYKDSYQDGASEELAGRGLYGDYVLLFPKQMLDAGFAIDKVEDVLLRIDYLSVDNLSQ